MIDTSADRVLFEDTPSATVGELMVAVAVTVPDVAVVILPRIDSAGRLPIASGPGRVQVTTWPPAEQLQPVPEALW